MKDTYRVVADEDLESEEAIGTADQPKNGHHANSEEGIGDSSDSHSYSSPTEPDKSIVSNKTEDNNDVVVEVGIDIHLLDEEGGEVANQIHQDIDEHVGEPQLDTQRVGQFPMTGKLFRVISFITRV